MNSSYRFDSTVKFRPWIGENYEKPLNVMLRKNRVRLLVLGEAHYGPKKNNQSEFTNKMVCGAINGVYSFRFITQIGQSLSGESRLDMGEENFRKVWNDIAFYNYIQQIVGENARTKPTHKMSVDAIEPFLSVLQTLKPTHVWVCGHRLWHHCLPNDAEAINYDGAYEERGKIKVPGYTAAIGAYTVRGVRSIVFRTYHPSYSKFSWKTVHEVLKKILSGKAGA